MMSDQFNNEEMMDSVLLEADSHDSFLRMLMGSLVSTTKPANNFPKSDLDYKYHESFGTYRDTRDVNSSKSVEMIEKLLSYCKSRDGDSTSTSQLNSEETDPYFYSQIVDAIDMLLERAELSLSLIDADRFGQEASTIIKQSLLYDKERIIREHLKDIPKPQDRFDPGIDNKRETLFVPLLKRKFHARIEYKPVVQFTDENNTKGFYSHPYEFELQRLEYPSYLLKKPKNIESVMPDSSRPYDFVKTEVCLQRLIEDLKSCKDIAIDLEHHSMRSFQGLTCLMQISTRTKDYLIDALALRLQLPQLGEIFANPKIVKVFHGCENALYWLQRDFGLYVVNCFDTYLAAKQLRFPALSLAHLVRVYCGVTLDKTHQLSDWRQRPLGEDLEQYARCDTMYLLYIFDRLRRDLWNAGSPSVSDAYQSRGEISESGSTDFIEAVLAGSKRLCLNVYTKPVFDPEGYKVVVAIDRKLIRSTNGTSELTEVQIRVLSALWDWRDKEARDRDESTMYILSNAELIRLGMTPPRGIEELRDKIASQALAILTPYALQSLDDIAKVIQAGLLGNWTGSLMEWSEANVESAASLPLQAAVSPVKTFKRAATTGNTFATHTASAMPVAPSAQSTAGSSSLSILTTSNAHFNPALGQTSSAKLTAQSPVMPLDEMFRRAGWKTPQHKGTMDADEDDVDRLVPDRLAVLSPVAFEAVKPMALKDQQGRVSKSFETLYKSLEGKIGLETMLREIAFGGDGKGAVLGSAESSSVADSTEFSAIAGSTTAAESITDGKVPSIPRSFEEIYRLSGKLRSKKQQQNQQQQSGAAAKDGNFTKRDQDTMLMSKLPAIEDDEDGDDSDEDLHSYLVRHGLAKSNSNKKGGSMTSSNQQGEGSGNVVTIGENKELAEQTVRIFVCCFFLLKIILVSTVGIIMIICIAILRKGNWMVANRRACCNGSRRALPSLGGSAV